MNAKRRHPDERAPEAEQIPPEHDRARALVSQSPGEPEPSEPAGIGRKSGNGARPRATKQVDSSIGSRHVCKTYKKEEQAKRRRGC